MKQRDILKTTLITLTVLGLLLPSSTWAQKQKKYKPCGINLTSLSHTAGAPGSVFKLYGRWGSTQGTKIPCINKGGMNRLIVLHWSNSAIKVRIPAGLAPGLYKVGVYCNDLSLGGSYSSGWKDFKVTGGGPAGRVDVDVSDIYVDKKCRLWVKHTNRGTAPLNVVLRERVWVNGRLIDDSRETINIAPGRWYGHGILADPGYIVRGTVKVKIQIDVDNALREFNERNNIMTKTIKCRPLLKKVMPLRKKK
jgi:hypothetical protein